MVLRLGRYQHLVLQRLERWEATRFSHRLWDKDPTLWFDHPVAELTDRLGWLSAHEYSDQQLADLRAFGAEIKTEGVRHVVLLGMGGSSLAPEVYQQTLGSAPGHPELIVLDSTHPVAVRAVERRIDLARSVFVVSSKSGTTLESLSFFRFFWGRLAQTKGRPGAGFIAITDPGTPLETLARERGFRRVFRAPEDVGGRYSALTVFGLVPAALIGVDVTQLVRRARLMADACGGGVPPTENPGLMLGAALGELAVAGRDKVTFVTSPGLAAFPSWLEQLIAESTGKDGKGIIPVADEPLGEPVEYGADRFFIALLFDGEEDERTNANLSALEMHGHPVARIQLADRLDLAQEMFRWEIAVAAAGTVLSIHPFNQPDVELAKDLARQAMASKDEPTGDFHPTDDTLSAADTRAMVRALGGWLASVRTGDYMAVQAYLEPTREATDAVQAIRARLRHRFRVATTIGYGPRFLHSTGQLHKGGPNTGVFLQLLDEPEEDLPVPETGYTFGAVIRAQALGDYRALKQRGRRVARINLGRDVGEGLRRLAETLHELREPA